MMTYWIPFLTTLQAIFTGGSAFQIAMVYQRRGSTYSLIGSICAAGMAMCLGMQWLTLVLEPLWHGKWPPAISINNTAFFGIIFFLLVRSRGNVARMFDFTGDK